MLFAEARAAMLRAPLSALDGMMQALWADPHSGLSDDEAQSLAELARDRRTAPKQLSAHGGLGVAAGAQSLPDRYQKAPLFFSASCVAPAAPAQKPFAPARRRVSRRPLNAPEPGPYRLPQQVTALLMQRLAPYRNGEAALALAVFLARYHSAPRRVASAFPVDRRALVGHVALGLTEARVRGALRALEEIGFVDREECQGSGYRPTDDGLRRIASRWRFGEEFRVLFERAHHKARADIGLRRQLPVAEPSAKSPKSISDPARSLLMGEISTRSSRSPVSIRCNGYPGIEVEGRSQLRRVI